MQNTIIEKNEINDIKTNVEQVESVNQFDKPADCVAEETKTHTKNTYDKMEKVFDV